MEIVKLENNNDMRLGNQEESADRHIYLVKSI